jgi:FkbM family methyltransferase
MTQVTTLNGRIVSLATKLAVSGPWRGMAETLTCAIGHKFPTSRAVISFCRHFAGRLIEREGERFERVAVFTSGGKMSCGGGGKLGPICSMYYFVGNITGQDEDERPLVKLLSRAIREGDIFFDIGASFGFYSFFIGPLCGLSGTVHSFEANPLLIQHLLRSAELNKSRANIFVNEVAVGKESNTTLKLYDPERIGGSSLFPLEWLNTGRSITVPLTTIDDYCRAKNINRLDVIKIDIEGAELDAFYGMLATFETCPPWLIVCEIILSLMSHGGGDSLEILAFLFSKGYEARQICEEDGRLGGLIDRATIERLSQNLVNVAFVKTDLKKSRPDLFAS